VGLAALMSFIGRRVSLMGHVWQLVNARKFSKTFLWLLSLVTKTAISTKSTTVPAGPAGGEKYWEENMGGGSKWFRSPFYFFFLPFLPFPPLTMPTTEASMFWVGKKHWKKLQNNFLYFCLDLQLGVYFFSQPHSWNEISWTKLLQQLVWSLSIFGQKKIAIISKVTIDSWWRQAAIMDYCSWEYLNNVPVVRYQGV